MIIGIVIAAAAVVIAGAYIRWAIGPVAGAYQLGLAMGRQLGPKPGGRHAITAPEGKRHSDTGPQLAATGS